MTVRHTRRVRHFRGGRRHGWGVTKGHTKSGMRGGVGKSGTKSRHKIQVIIGQRPPIGKHGFTRPQKVVSEIKTMNVSHLEAMLPTLIEKKKAELTDKIYHIDLSALGIDKLLAQGEVTVAMNVKVDSASKRAIEKIEKAGGKVLLEE